MSFRFQRHVKSRPGVRLNIHGSAVSTSFGMRSAPVSAQSGKHRITFGVPGDTSYTATARIRRALPPVSAMNALSGLFVMVFVGIVVWHVAFT
jgi:hypothetical protein